LAHQIFLKYPMIRITFWIQKNVTFPQNYISPFSERIFLPWASQYHINLSQTFPQFFTIFRNFSQFFESSRYLEKWYQFFCIFRNFCVFPNINSPPPRFFL
jgi:hypothetical protein